MQQPEVFPTSEDSSHSMLVSHHGHRRQKKSSPPSEREMTAAVGNPQCMRSSLREEIMGRRASSGSSHSCESPTLQLGGNQPRSSLHCRARQARKSMSCSVSNMGPCRSPDSTSGDSEQGLHECDHHKGNVSEASGGAALLPPSGERRRRGTHRGKAQMHRREQRRQSDGHPSSTRPLIPPASATLGATRERCTIGTAMLERDEGAHRYYHRRPTSPESVAAFATEGAAEAELLACRRCEAVAVELCSREGNPLARASAVCEAYFQLLSRR